MYCMNLKKSSLGVIKDRRTRRNRTITMDTTSHRSYSKIDPHQQRLLNDGMEVSDKSTVPRTGHTLGVYDYDLNLPWNENVDGFFSPSPPNENEKATVRLSKFTASLKGSFRRSRSRLSRARKSREQTSPISSSTTASDFQKELQQVHRMRQRKQKWDEEKKDDGVTWREEELQCYPPPPPPGFPPLSNNATSLHTLDDGVDDDLNASDELQKLRQMFELERIKNLALKDKLDETELQLKASKKAQSNEYVGHYTQNIRQLQQEVSHYRELWQNERQLRFDIEVKFESLRREHARQEERMDIIMFQHFPSIVPKFKDIGTVNYSVAEKRSTVGQFSIGRLLGEGHYGSVRVATRDNTRYAVKIIKKSRLQRFKDYQQVALEVHVLKHYRHPGIIHLHDVLHGIENIYLVTELCAMDLHQYHNEIGLSETSAKHVIYGLLCAVSHLHAHSIGHADLKPENIMLTEVPGPDDLKYTHVKLGDFGLCMMACNPSEDSGIHRNGYACGTPGFYAPEMAIQDCFEARQADMWSIGCITLEITLGFPYEWNEAYEAADSDVEEFRMSLESALENINMVLHSSHKQLVEMIFSCLSIDPKKRATSSEALRHPWLAKVASSASESYSTRRISSHWNQLYEDRMDLLSSSALCQ